MSFARCSALLIFFFSSRRRHTRCLSDWSSDVCSSDLVRMYLKQMGQVPLLTREQEVEISKRIENAELKAQEALFHASAVGGYIAVLGAKLLNREERFDRIVIDKKIESRDAYFRTLPKLV